MYLFRTEDNCSAIHSENANSSAREIQRRNVGQYSFSRSDESASIYYAETEHILHQQLVPTRELECLFRLKYQLHVRVCRLEFVSFLCILLFFIYSSHVTPRTDANENDWPLYSFAYAPIHTPTYWPATLRTQSIWVQTIAIAKRRGVTSVAQHNKYAKAKSEISVGVVVVNGEHIKQQASLTYSTKIRCVRGFVDDDLISLRLSVLFCNRLQTRWQQEKATTSEQQYPIR